MAKGVWELDIPSQLWEWVCGNGKPDTGLRIAIWME